MAREKNTYLAIFRKILEEEPLWVPEEIFVSREVALTSAIQETFDDCKIMHSWFHLALVRNLPKLCHSNINFDGLFLTFLINGGHI